MSKKQADGYMNITLPAGKQETEHHHQYGTRGEMFRRLVMRDFRNSGIVIPTDRPTGRKAISMRDQTPQSEHHLGLGMEKI